MRVRFEEIQDTDAARKFVGKKVFLPLDQLPALEGKQFYFHEVIGWKAVDENNRLVGYILDVLDRGPQELLLVKSPEEQRGLPPTGRRLFAGSGSAERRIETPCTRRSARSLTQDPLMDSNRLLPSGLCI